MHIHISNIAIQEDSIPEYSPRNAQVFISSIPGHIRDADQGMLYVVTLRYH